MYHTLHIMWCNGVDQFLLITWCIRVGRLHYATECIIPYILCDAMEWTSSYWLHDALEWTDYIMQQNGFISKMIFSSVIKSSANPDQIAVPARISQFAVETESLTRQAMSLKDKSSQDTIVNLISTLYTLFFQNSLSCFEISDPDQLIPDEKHTFSSIW